MAKIIPFCAVRPRTDLADRIAAKEVKRFQPIMEEERRAKKMAKTK